MVAPELYQSLLNASFRFVSYRPRSRKEIVDFLQKKMKKWGVAGAVTFEKVMDRLQDLGYIDDKKFAQWWVDQRNAFRPKGMVFVARELYQKGIDREIIEQTLAKSSGDETEAARTVAHKKLNLLRHLPKLDKKKKLYGLLGRRGFSSETISRVVDELITKAV